MATDNKTSNLIESQFPAYFRQEAPNLVAFVRAYYEWMETSNNVIDVAKNFQNLNDLDGTYDEFLEYFRNEIMSGIPKSILADKRLLAKHIKDLYRAKGSENSYKLLFRILYDDNVEFYYPGEDILRCSDGRWVQENSVRVGSPIVGNISDIEGNIIIGQNTGATAKVERIVTTIESGVDIYELFLSNISGSFADLETVANKNNTISARILNTVGPIQAVTVINGGAGHHEGDIVHFIGSGTGAEGVVTKTSDTSAATFELIKGGHGYRLNSTIRITGGSGTGATFAITELANLEVISYRTDLIKSLRDVIIATGPTFVTLGANSTAVSSELASANVSTVIGDALGSANVTVGSISEITTTNFGSGYASLPSVDVEDTQISALQIPAPGGGIKGHNAVIVANNAPGGIATVSVRSDRKGSAYTKLQNLTIVNVSSGATVNAIGTPVITGIINYPGSYIGTRGWLSWDKKLQDNYYYQEYSYVLKSSTPIDFYRKFVKDLLHPAGTKMFAEMQIHIDDGIAISMVSETELNITTATIGYEANTPLAIMDVEGNVPNVSVSPGALIPKNTISVINFVPMISAGAGIEIPLNSLTTSGKIPVITAGKSVFIPADSVTFTNYTPTVTAADNTEPTPANTASQIIEMGIGPNGSVPYLLTGGLGEYTFTNQTVVDIPAGNVTFTNYTPTVTALTGTNGISAFINEGVGPNGSIGYFLTAGLGNF